MAINLHRSYVIVNQYKKIIVPSITEKYMALKTHIITDCWNSCKAICKSANNYTHSIC